MKIAIFLNVGFMLIVFGLGATPDQLIRIASACLGGTSMLFGVNAIYDRIVNEGN